MEIDEVPRTRMPAAERRELILRDATAVFASNGYGGTTTDLVAQAAGVSQPYVVRMFGTKEKLFLAVLERAERILAETFRAAIPGPDGKERRERMGMAYVGLIAERGLHQVLMQAFLLGGDPVVGPEARSSFLRIWRLAIDEAGMTEEDARSFIANGMLINTLVALRLGDAYGADPDIDAMFTVAFPCSFDVFKDNLPTAAERY
ncbi:TetR/AcrR family transcriptional regulator [Sinomonas sp. ASV322]|uniref:TetR/AcrR family transcriptional regulator n=1 Tax=Sinomonas sp. ASV322 TaxID=3041920 RepID=UPI0027DE23F7|nr:TetR/AcrR family transcriptional regulator [Sinomonas sp. ASV322]MDQ4501361.1 TetR/AcrR family transcriptional regulator [Sinomonas sp. ASV322]